MATSSRSASAPLTFDLPLSLISRIEKFRRSSALKTSSEVVRLAVDQYDFESCSPAHDPHRQISVRINARQRSALKRFANKNHASVGELLRLALEELASKPAKKARR